MVPIINNFPILEFVLYSLAYGIGLRNFVFGVKGTKNYTYLQNYFQGGSGWSAKLGISPQVHFEYQNPNYDDEGSADSTRYNIEEYDISSPILVVQADNLFWADDIKKLYKQAVDSPYPFTVGLTYAKDASQLGVAVLDKKTQRITNFLEKPGAAYKSGGVVSTGIYAIKPEAFKYLKGDFGKDVIPMLTEKGKVGGCVFEHPWYDFGNPKEHLNSVMSLLKEPSPCFGNFLSRVCTEYKNGQVRVWIRGKSSFSLKRAMQIIKRIESGRITVKGSVFIGKDSVIGNGVTLKNCSIGDLSFVGSGCEISKSNVLDARQIGKNSKIKGSFLGRGGSIAEGSKIEKQFLGDGTDIA